MALPLLAAAARAQGPAGDTAFVALSLDEVVRLAVAASPDVARGQGAVRTAGAAERVARFSYVPTLSADANTIQSTTPSPVSQPGALGGVSDGTSAFGLSTSVDLYTGGRRGAERRRARASSDAATADLISRRFAAALEAKRAFFEVLRGAELARVAQARVERAQQGLAAARRRHEVGTATRSDELRAQLELSTAQQELLSAQAARRSAAYELGRLVGRDDAVDARPDSSLAPHPLALADSQIVALVVGASPAVRSAEANTRAASADIDAQRARYFPTLQTTGGVRWLDQPEAAVLGSRALWDIRLGLSLPLFDGMRREEAVTTARANADVADAELRDRRRAARSAAERSLAALHTAEQRIALAEEGVRDAEEDLRVQEARYRAGATTVLERITSQLNLATAESALVGARFDYQLARAELEALAGRDL